MKRIFAYLAFAAALTFTVSCNKEAGDSFAEGEGNITLKLSVGAPATKADRNTTAAEDVVKSIDYLFYTDTTKALSSRIG